MPTQFIADWFTERIPLWNSMLGKFAGQPDLQFLEIGSFEGRSACWLLENILTHPTAHLTCIDPFVIGPEYKELLAPGVVPDISEYEKHFDSNMQEIHAGNRVTKIKATSQCALRTLPLDHYNMIYIDGSHYAASALQDIMLSWDLLKANGLLIIDDYEWICFPDEPLKTPKPAIDAFLWVFQGRYKLLHRQYQVIVEKLS